MWCTLPLLNLVVITGHVMAHFVDQYVLYGISVFFHMQMYRMPPRSKQSQRQPEWSACERCKCYVSARDTELHSEVCKDAQVFSCDLSDTDGGLQQLRHCFISSGSVVARLNGMLSTAGSQTYLNSF